MLAIETESGSAGLESQREVAEWLEERMRSKALRKNFSVDEVLSEMDKISVIELADGGRILLELTRKQKDFLRKLGVTQPQIQ